MACVGVVMESMADGSCQKRGFANLKIAYLASSTLPHQKGHPTLPPNVKIFALNSKSCFMESHQAWQPLASPESTPHCTRSGKLRVDSGQLAKPGLTQRSVGVCMQAESLSQNLTRGLVFVVWGTQRDLPFLPQDQASDIVTVRSAPGAYEMD